MVLHRAAMAAAVTGVGVRVVAGAVVARVVFPQHAGNANKALLLGAGATLLGLYLDGLERPSAPAIAAPTSTAAIAHGG